MERIAQCLLFYTHKYLNINIKTTFIYILDIQLRKTAKSIFFSTNRIELHPRLLKIMLMIFLQNKYDFGHFEKKLKTCVADVGKKSPSV